MTIALIIVAILAVIFIITRETKSDLFSFFTKTIASIAFVALGLIAVMNNYVTGVGVILILGLSFGMLGDMLLALKFVVTEQKDIFLTSGMISFSFEHIVNYIVFSLLALRYFKMNLTLPIIISAVAFIVLIVGIYFGAKVLKLNFGKFTIPALLYGAILGGTFVFTLVLAILNPSFIIFAIGNGLFFLSDLVLSKIYFGGQEKNHILSATNHILYYTAQILLAFGLFLL